jgi:hypothetical protein
MERGPESKANALDYDLGETPDPRRPREWPTMAML